MNTSLFGNRRIAAVLFLAAVVFFLCPMAAKVYAGYGGESQVQSFFDGTAGFLVKTIGTGVFVLGMIVAGIKITAGDQNGLRNAVMVMIGGAVIFLSRTIVDILSKFSGS